MKRLEEEKTMEKGSLKYQLQRIAALCLSNIQLAAPILTIGIGFVILADCKQSEFIRWYGRIVVTFAILLWGAATYYMLKYVKTKKNAREARKQKLNGESGIITPPELFDK